MNPRTRVKICGITRVEDGLQAARLGVDAIGLVFYEKSPRHVSLQQAAEICAALPGFVTTVSLFFNATEDHVQQVLQALPVDLIQFHGSESAAFCRSFGRPYIKALGMADNDRLLEQLNDYRDARAILLDSHAPGAAGGTGQAFDWHSIPRGLAANMILAGGLTPANIADAIHAVRPYGVDLSSGVEAQPGIKDAMLMRQLINEVKRVDCEHD